MKGFFYIMIKPVSTLRRMKDFDAAREGVPGEHWITLGAALATWLLTRSHPSSLVRTTGMLAGAALVGRAASGRDGLTKVVRRIVPYMATVKRLPFRR